MSSRPLIAGVCLLVLLLGAALALFPVASFDIWWHLATGRWIIEHRAVPGVDPFSHTAAGAPWVTHEWLAEVLFFLVHRLGGTDLLILFKALAVAGALLLLLLASQRTLLRLALPDREADGSPREKGLLWLCAAAALLPAAHLLSFRAFVRPHLFTVLFLAAELAILLPFRLGRPARLRRLLPLQWLWANLHAGSLFGLLLTGVLLAGRWLDRRKRPVQGRRLLATAAAMLAVSLINPNGIHALLYPFRLAGSGFFRGAIQELQPAYAPAYRGAFWQYAFLLTALGALAGLARLPLRRYPDFWLLVGAALAGGVAAMRNVPLAGVLATPFLALALHRLLAPRPRITRLAAPAIALLALLQLGALAARGTFIGSEGWRRPGLGADPRKLPAGAVEFLREEGITGNAFNNMAFGSYLIWAAWPGIRPYVDGRLDVFGEAFLQRYLELLHGAPDALEELASRNVEICLLDFPPPGGRWLHTALWESPDWALVYWDDIALVYLRTSPRFAALIERAAFRVVDPTRRTLEAIRAQIRANPEAAYAELQRTFARRPDTRGARLALAIAARDTGRTDEARTLLQAEIAADPDASAPREILAALELEAGRYEAARQQLLLLARRFPKAMRYQLDLGVSYHRQGMLDQAEEHYREALRLAPRDIRVLDNLGILHAQRKEYAEAERYWRRVLAIDPGNRAVQQKLARLRRITGG
jgi:Flp pilus assembly protein TadD